MHTRLAYVQAVRASMREYIINSFNTDLISTGWTSACSPVAGSKTFFSAPTTGVQCCPSGFSCDDSDWCVQQPVETAVPVWSIYTDKWGIEGAMTSSAFPEMKAMAKPIFVAYQSSDKALLASATITGTGTQPTLTPTSATSNSLSGGAIAGIAIGAAAGGILASVLFFLSLWFCLGYRFRRERPGTLSGESQHELAAKERSTAVQLDSRQKANLSQYSATELASGRHTPADGTVELDTSAIHGRSELAGTYERKP
jgi:hypothetical protein